MQSAIEIMLTSRYPMLVWWGEQLIQFYNDAYIPVLGRRHPWGLGQPAAVCWEEAWPFVGALADAVMTDGVSTWSEQLEMVMTRNGFPEEVYMTFSYSPILNESQVIGGLFCTCTEDTQRVLSDRRLTALGALADVTASVKTTNMACEAIATLLASIPRDLSFTLLYLLDEEQRIAHLSSATGTAPGTAASPQQCLLDGAEQPWPFSQVLARGAMATVERLPNGPGLLFSSAWPEPTHAAVIIPVARSGRTGLAGFLVVGLSPRLVFDEQYRTFLRLLARQVAATLTAAQAYEQERQRAEALAKIDHAKTTFFSNVSHEFRTPLTLMLGMLESVLAGSTLTAQDRKHLLTGQRNALRLLRLVNTLLDFSRVEAGRAQANYEPTDLAAFTAELASSFRSACETANLHLTIEATALDAPVYVDREMWEKIVFNIVSNAFKFTLQGGIRIRVRRDGKTALVSIRDTGVGISKHELPHIFERFYRVENAKGRTHEGSGIGLALVRELVTLNGGSVGVESVEGRGTTFSVRLPFGEAHLPADRIAAASAFSSTATRAQTFVEEALRWLPSAAPAANGHGETGPLATVHGHVLIVDDNADMRDYLKQLLRVDYTVSMAANGEQALQLIDRQVPDLVIADVMMPKLDGFGFLKALRANPSAQALPVILLSVKAGEEAKVEGLAAGADDYLVKPFSSSELLARVAVNLELATLRQNAYTRRESQRNLQQNEIWLRAQREAFRTAMSGASLEMSLGVLVDAITSSAQDARRCAFYIADETGGGLRHVVGMSEAYARAVDGFQISPESLACGLALASGKPVLTADVMEDPHWRPWTWLAWDFGYRGCWSFPVETTSGRAVGSFAMYLRNPQTPSGRDLELGLAVSQAAAIIIAHYQQSEERIRSEERLRLFGEASQEVLWIRDADLLRWHYLNPAFEVIYGATRPAALALDSYQSWLDLVLPEDRERADHNIQLARGGENVTFDFRIKRPGDGTIRWLRNTEFPILGRNGHVALIGGIGHDFTELREAQLRLQTLIEGIAQLVWRADQRGSWTWASPQWTEYTGQRDAESLNWGWLDAVHPEDHEVAKAAWVQALISGIFQVEYRVFRVAERDYRWFQTRAMPVKTEAGEVIEWLGSSTDIHELRLLQERQRLLVGELQHRTRNLMSVVRSMANRVGEASEDLADFRGRFNDRLGALARVQGMLSRLSETDRLAFDELIETELAAMNGVADKVTIEGPRSVKLRSSMVQTLALAIHELATNSVKYGALGQPQAHLTIRWRMAPPDRQGRPWLHIDWLETNVRMPAAVGSQRSGGQGRELIEQALPYQLSAETRFYLGPDGLHCSIAIPVSTSNALSYEPHH